MQSKWLEDDSHFDGFGLDSLATVTPSPPNLHGGSTSSSTPINMRDSRINQIDGLLDSLTRLGVRIADHCECDDWSESTRQVLWSLIGCVDRSRVDGSAGRETLSRLEHDNKRLKGMIDKLNGDISRQRDVYAARESQYQKQIADLSSKLEKSCVNRDEWEKAALTYKSREKRFQAELRKQDNDYDQLQDRLRRSVSISGPRIRILEERTPPPPISTSGRQSVESMFSQSVGSRTIRYR